MRFDTAQISLIGNRPENQDRTEILRAEGSLLAIVADGMGGHARGALAAETAVASLGASFRDDRSPRDPDEFLRAALACAHATVFALGKDKSFTQRPGTTAVCALVSGEELRWVHVGDSRAYHFRAARLLDRSRDHTRIESRLAAGEISPEAASLHPDRHVVEYCLGVLEDSPPAEVSAARRLEPGDVVLLCSDGFWSQLDEERIGERLATGERLAPAIRALAEEAASGANPHSDNVSAVALRVAADSQADPCGS
ncbi:MAG TPA: protein phosphatase 2C domain-containing protein [Gammaproteobacteria bacterium]|nr:protein phosphatase 2C domain-containing protein [Gammaproteobacteria bacterium]